MVESHTHFPTTNYPGPKFDRVKLFEDTDRDGKPGRISAFADGSHNALNLAFGQDGGEGSTESCPADVGHLYVTHRNGVLRLDDKDGDGVSESRATILEMDTPASYPHNGISGIAFSHDDWLYVGQGHNLGERYTLKGTDGTTHSGKGEGGSIFRCRPDGSRLQLVATGFWNLFGLAFYGKHFLLAEDNDPDSRPPNRLLDVVMCGDYGFKYRLGRNGLHPFQSWNGELPGSLPMLSGASEGACNILPCDQTSFPSGYREAILVTAAWDHRVEVHRPKPFGASRRADHEVLVQGDESFRPVGIATASASDGSLYLTDWVDASYNVHGKGRLLRLMAKTGTRAKPGTALTIAVNASRRKMERLSGAGFPELQSALVHNDPFVRSAAITALSKPAFRDAVENELENKSPEVRLGALLALRRVGSEDAGVIVSKMLANPDEPVRRMALV